MSRKVWSFGCGTWPITWPRNMRHQRWRTRAWLFVGPAWALICGGLQRMTDASTVLACMNYAAGSCFWWRCRASGCRGLGSLGRRHVRRKAVVHSSVITRQARIRNKPRRWSSHLQLWLKLAARRRLLMRCSQVWYHARMSTNARR